MRFLAWFAGVLLAGLLYAPPVEANWLTRLIGAAEKAGGRAARHGGTLAGLAAHIKALPRRPNVHALGAVASAEGHWRFVNKAGEMFTAGSPEELRRAFHVLIPEAAGDKGKVTLYLNEETVLRHRASLKELPQHAELQVLIGAKSYPLVRQSADAGSHLYVETHAHLLVELTDRRLFDETMFQLGRRLDKWSIRVVALEPGGAGSLTRAPRVEAAGGRVIDSLEPDRLHQALSSLRGQTVLVTGRVEGGLLHFKPAGGPEGSLVLEDLMTAAESADVNLIVLKSASQRQPGGRSWLWQRIEVSGLDPALARADLSDFMAALASGRGRMVVTATQQGPARTTLSVAPAEGLPGAPGSGSFGDMFSEIVAELTGNVVTSGIEAGLRSAERQHELDSRLLPGVPSDIQFFYLGLVGLGFFGLPVARRWWQKVWPPKRREEYGSALGYRSGRIARNAAMVILFVPLVAPASVPLQVLAGVRRVARGGWRGLVLIWRTLTFRNRRDASAS